MAHSIDGVGHSALAQPNLDYAPVFAPGDEGTAAEEGTASDPLIDEAMDNYVAVMSQVIFWRFKTELEKLKEENERILREARDDGE
jgi:hypothetical protein